MGMAFVDELLSADRHVHITLVDRRASPGGHWNDAYSFVRLHQPAIWYGVNSEPLGDGGKDLASKGQILGYYDRVLAKLLRTGRLRFLGQCEYLGDGTVRSLLAQDLTHEIRVRRRVVDGTYSQITVPATTPPSFLVDDGVDLVPIGALADIERPRARYVVIGAGKTGMDALLHLLDAGVPASRLTWVVSRDAWLVNRAAMWKDEMGAFFLAMAREAATATSVDALFVTMESLGYFLRVDPSRPAQAYRCATVSTQELASLQRVRDVVRRGRISRLTPAGMEFQDGCLEMEPDVLYVDCTADGLKRRPRVDVFADRTITLQPVAQCQPTFSGALIAKVETRSFTDAQRNALTRPIPHPNVPVDSVNIFPDLVQNQDGWLRHLLPWLVTCRLNPGSHLGAVSTVRLLAGTALIKQRTLDGARRITELEGPAD
jgi:hypothetical protein